MGCRGMRTPSHSENFQFGKTKIGRMKIGRTKINRRKLVDTKIGRYENWSLRKLVDANISRDLIIKEKTVLIKKVEWQFEI